MEQNIILGVLTMATKLAERVHKNVNENRTSKDKVLAWIEENFDTTELTLIDFPILPGGTRIIDCGLNEMYVYYDILNDRVTYRYSTM